MTPATARSRSAWLFLAAMVLPCVVLVALGARMIAEGEEVARARLADDQRRLTSTIGSDLKARLDRIKLEQTSGQVKSARTVALVGELRDGQLLLPSDLDPAQSAARQSLDQTVWGQLIAQAESFEFHQDYTRAIDFYRRAFNLATSPFERGYNELLAARVFVACKCTDDATPIYHRLLETTAVDDTGVPLALYSARQLVELQTHEGNVLNLIEARIRAAEPVAPAALYLQRSVLETLAKPGNSSQTRASALLAKMQPQLDDLGQALALKRDVARIVSSAGSGGDEWTLFGRPEWLIGIARVSGRAPVVVAVRARELLGEAARDVSSSAASPAAIEFVLDGSGGDSIDRAFPGLRVKVAMNESVTMRAWQKQRTYFIATLLLVVAVTLSGSYMLWRNMRREVRLAELRSQFVSSVSHELRTPLTAIRMFAETLQLGRQLEPATQAEYLSTIVSESERLTRLLNNVLDFSKIERGERVYRLEEDSLDSVVRQAAGAMQYPLTRLGFELRLDVPDSMPPVRIDRDAIEQAVLNLLGNAMKYSRERRDIDLRLHQASGNAVIEVTDHGLGIAASEQQRIFERFYRAPVPENRLIPGTGLGLALVDHIVKGHGGRVEVRSAPGEGSTFAIHLPLAV